MIILIIRIEGFPSMETNLKAVYNKNHDEKISIIMYTRMRADDFYLKKDKKAMDPERQKVEKHLYKHIFNRDNIYIYII